MTTQQTEADSDLPEFAQEVIATENEFDQQKQEEEKRHKQKLEEIKENRKSAMRDLRDEAGFGHIESLHEQITEDREEVRSLRKQVQKVVKKALNEVLSGSYEEEITVRDGQVRRYRKKKNATIGFDQITGAGYSGYRSTIDNALERELNSRDAGAMKYILDQCKKHNDRFGGGWQVVFEDVEIEDPFETHFGGEPKTYEQLKVRYKGEKSYRSSNQYIKLGDHVGNPSFSPMTKNAKHMARLDIVQEHVEEAMEQIRDEVQRDRRELKNLLEQIEEDLPKGVEVETE